MKNTENHRSGYVAILGKPNAGKSTLMNRLLGSKVSITTHKPQTTRHQILGIHSEEELQIIFLVINKIDKLSEQECEIVAQNIQEKFDFDETLFVSAINGNGLQALMDTVKSNVKSGPPFYPKDMLSEQPVRFFVAEMIREQ